MSYFIKKQNSTNIKKLIKLCVQIYQNTPASIMTKLSSFQSELVPLP